MSKNTKGNKVSKIKSVKSLSDITPRYAREKSTASYSPKLDKLSTIQDKFCTPCQKMNYSLAAASSTNLRLNYRCKFCNKLI